MRFYDTVVGHRYTLYFIHRCFYYYYYMIVVIKKIKNKSRFEKKKITRLLFGLDKACKI